MTFWRACSNRAASTSAAAPFESDGLARCRAVARPVCRARTFPAGPPTCIFNCQSRGYRSLGQRATGRHERRAVHATNAAQLERSASLRQDYDASQIQVTICTAEPRAGMR